MARDCGIGWVGLSALARCGIGNLGRCPRLVWGHAVGVEIMRQQDCVGGIGTSSHWNIVALEHRHRNYIGVTITSAVESRWRRIIPLVLEFCGPKARPILAWANGPGQGYGKIRGLKARFKTRRGHGVSSSPQRRARVAASFSFATMRPSVGWKSSTDSRPRRRPKYSPISTRTCVSSSPTLARR